MDDHLCTGTAVTGLVDSPLYCHTEDVETMEQIPRRITHADSAGQAVEKAASASLALCQELRAHYAGVATLAAWLDARPTLLLDDDASAAITPLLVHAFRPGRAGFGQGATLPDSLGKCIEESRSLVTRLDEAIRRTIPQTRAAIALDDPLLAKAKAVLAEHNSLTSLERDYQAITSFTALLEGQPWGMEFLEGTDNPWVDLSPRHAPPPESPLP